MRSIFFWEEAGLSLTDANPYGGLLARGLARSGVELLAGYANEFDREWVLANRGRVDVLHLNWPHYLYDAPDLAGRVERLAALIDNLALARELGYKIVWTVHNLFPHDSSTPDLDRLARLAITQLSTALIAHCQYSRTLVQRHFHRSDGLFVIPHGHFMDVYPNTVSRQRARQKYGIGEDNFVYLFFGNVRPYKGLEKLLDVFCSLPDDHLRLLLAAKVYNEYGEQFVAHARQRDPRIIVHPSRFFANEEFQDFFNAADVSVLPFVDVLTSGSAITALGFGQPLITPGVGCLPELVDNTMGILYDPKRPDLKQPDVLEEAMVAIQTRDQQAMRQAAFQRARSLDWDEIGRRTLAAYRHGG
ncbi:MAG: glycosyltransferase [Caldilineaceae bacterium]